MNEQLQNALIELVTKTVGGIDGATAFLSSQLPDFVVQLIRYKIIYTFIDLACCVFVLFLCVKALKVGYKLWNDENDLVRDCDEPTIVAVISFVVIVILSISFFVSAFNDIDDIVSLLVAPKVYLVEFISKLGK